MADSLNARLILASRPENVIVVRQALAGVADALGLGQLELNDLTTAVSEAANNVVQHAYRQGPGPLEVSIYGLSSGVTVLVRDSGTGIMPRLSPDSEGSGIGLQIMLALARSVEFSEPAGGGTEVLLEFAFAPRHDVEEASGSLEPAAMLLDDDVILTLGPAAVTQAVLPRVLEALAARANFSTEGLEDAGGVARALTAPLDGVYFTVDVAARTRELLLTVPAMPVRRAAEILAGHRMGGSRSILELIDADAPAADGPALAIRIHETP